MFYLPMPVVMAINDSKTFVSVSWHSPFLRWGLF